MDLMDLAQLPNTRCQVLDCRSSMSLIPQMGRKGKEMVTRRKVLHLFSGRIAPREFLSNLVLRAVMLAHRMTLRDHQLVRSGNRGSASDSASHR